jgi:hypothetical protein
MNTTILLLQKEMYPWTVQHSINSVTITLEFVVIQTLTGR